MATDDMELIVANLMKGMSQNPPEAKPDQVKYDRQFVIDRHMSGLKHVESSNKSSKAPQPMFTASMDESPNSLLPAFELKPENRITLKEISQSTSNATIFEGKFVLCRSLAPSWRINAMFLVIDDPEGDTVMDLMVYNWTLASVPVGCIFALMNPFFKLTKSGCFSLRCDNPVVHIVRVKDDSLLNNLEFSQKLDFDDQFSNVTTTDLNKAGIQYFKEGSYERSFEAFSRALNLPEYVDKKLKILINRSATAVELEKFDVALEDAEAGLEMDSDNEKLQFRKALVLFKMQKYEDCLDFVAKYCHPNLSIKQLVRDAQRSAKESKYGEYDYELMWQQAESGSLDRHADYFAGHLVELAEIEGYNRGLVAKVDLAPNTLIIAERAFAFDSDKLNDKNNTFSLDMEQKRASMNTSKVLAKMCERLKRRSELGVDLYHLSAGEKLGYLTLTEEEARSKPVDVVRLKEIILVNSFGDGNQSEKSRGVWVKASYINHACVDVNLTRQFIGDFMFVRTIKAVPKGSQLLFQYGPVTAFEQREFNLKIARGFECHCRLCEMERTESREIREKLSVIDMQVRTEMASYFKNKEDPSEKLQQLLDECQHLRPKAAALNLLGIKIQKLLGSIYMNSERLNDAVFMIERAFEAYEELGLIWEALDSAIGIASCFKTSPGSENDYEKWQAISDRVADMFIGDRKLLPMHLEQLSY